jgi:hypothetical protein
MFWISRNLLLRRRDALLSGTGLRCDPRHARVLGKRQGAREKQAEKHGKNNLQHKLNLDTF